MKSFMRFTGSLVCSIGPSNESPNPRPSTYTPEPSLAQTVVVFVCLPSFCHLSSTSFMPHYSLHSSLYTKHPQVYSFSYPSFAPFFQVKDASVQCKSKKGNNLWTPTPPTPLLHGSTSCLSIDRLHSAVTLIPINNDPRKTIKELNECPTLLTIAFVS